MVDLGAYKDKFGDSGQRVLENALSESRRRDQNFIAVEHIIFALAKEEADLFNSTIRSLAIDPEQYLAVAERTSAGGPPRGMRTLLRRLRGARRGLVIGNFARGLAERA